MMVEMTLIGVALLVGIIAFEFGCAVTASPTEAEMFERLVSIRAQRKLQELKMRGLEEEIEAAIEKKVA